MSETQKQGHTPGPWQAEFGTEGYFKLMHDDGRDLPGTEENEALLGAAPSLLTALEWAMDEIDNLSNRAFKFGYPQGIGFQYLPDTPERDAALREYTAARAALALVKP